jgi:hypothetical protein
LRFLYSSAVTARKKFLSRLLSFARLSTSPRKTSRRFSPDHPSKKQTTFSFAHPEKLAPETCSRSVPLFQFHLDSGNTHGHKQRPLIVSALYSRQKAGLTQTSKLNFLPENPRQYRNLIKPDRLHPRRTRTRREMIMTQKIFVQNKQLSKATVAASR